VSYDAIFSLDHCWINILRDRHKRKDVWCCFELKTKRIYLKFLYYCYSLKQVHRRRLFWELLSWLINNWSTLKMASNSRETSRYLLTISFLISSEIPCVYSRPWIGAVFRSHVNSLEYISFRLTLALLHPETTFCRVVYLHRYNV
jgi:hypothetical protein